MCFCGCERIDTTFSPKTNEPRLEGTKEERSQEPPKWGRGAQQAPLRRCMGLVLGSWPHFQAGRPFNTCHGSEALLVYKGSGQPGACSGCCHVCS